QDDPGGIVVKHPGDTAYQRIKQADIDHDAEEHDGEHQQCRGGCHVLDGVEHHFPHAQPGACDEAEDSGDQEHGHHGGQATQHDQCHEGEDHGETQDDQHTIGGCVTDRV